MLAATNPPAPRDPLPDSARRVKRQHAGASKPLPDTALDPTRLARRCGNHLGAHAPNPLDNPVSFIETTRSSTTHAFANDCLRMKALVRFPAWTWARVEESFMGPPVDPPRTSEPARGRPKPSETALDGRDRRRLPGHEHAIFSRRVTRSERSA